MLIVQRRRGAAARHDAELILPFELRQKSRLRTAVASGEEIGLFLPRGSVLRDGDCLEADDGRVVRVTAAPEELIEVRCADAETTERMKARIDAAKKAGESLGGIFEVAAVGLPPGLGSYTQWDRKLDGLLAQAILSINAIKGVEFGEGFAVARLPGTQAQDSIRWGPGRPTRTTNRAGGTEGGTTNGEPLVLRGAMKPIATTTARSSGKRWRSAMMAVVSAVTAKATVR